MKHFHLIVGPIVGDMAANVRYENYEDSVAAYVRMTRQLFEGRFDEEELTIEKVVVNTAGSQGIYMGVPSMSVVWVPCEEQPCISALWN